MQKMYLNTFQYNCHSSPIWPIMCLVGH